MELTIENLHAEYHKSIFGWINSKINDTMVAEELANDVFIKAYENLGEYDQNEAKVSTWIFTIAKNHLIDYFRKRKLQTTSMTDMEDDEGNDLFYYTDNTTPETDMVNNELGNTIMNAIISLPSKYQTIVDMFLIKEKSHEEISESLSIPIGTVKGTIHRAKKLLQKRLTNF